MNNTFFLYFCCCCWLFIRMIMITIILWMMMIMVVQKAKNKIKKRIETSWCRSSESFCIAHVYWVVLWSVCWQSVLNNWKKSIHYQKYYVIHTTWLWQIAKNQNQTKEMQQKKLKKSSCINLNFWNRLTRIVITIQSIHHCKYSGDLPNFLGRINI